MGTVVGIDLGGTNVRAALVDEAGNIQGDLVHRPSRARDGVSATVSAIAAVLQEAMAGNSVQAVGIAVPGHIDPHEGTVLWAPNFGEETNGEFAMWRDVALTQQLHDAMPSLDCPVVLANDANAAALGEYRYGVGKNSAGCLVLWTLGTGVGSGVVLGRRATHPAQRNPSILVGASGGAVELGHMTVEVGGALCTCGAYGCIEAYCGTPGLLRLAAEAGVSALSPAELSEQAEAGVLPALEVWRSFGRYFGAAVGNCINTFGPDVVAVGGQIANAWAYFESATLAVAQRQSVPSIWKRCRVVPAEKRNDAGVLGAAALAWGA